MKKIYYLISLCTLITVIMALMTGCATSPISSEKAAGGEYVWPPPPETPRIKWLTQWSNRLDFGRQGGLFNLLVGEEKIEKLKRANGVVADSAGSVYVADSENGVIFVFDQEKKTLRFLGFGTLAGPIGLAIDNKKGVVYVSDARLKRVIGFDKERNSIVMNIGAPGEFQNPSGMVFDELRDRLYVADARNHVVKVFDKDGKPILSIGKRGSGDGEFNFPSYLALDRNGNLYVVDSFNFRVQIFDPNGKFIKKFGKIGDASGSFSRPNGIGVDSDDHIYVVDAAFNNFQIFDNNGKLLLWIGNAGRNPGEFYLPSGMYIDKQDRIYVTDTFNQRVQVFQYLKEKK